MKLRNKRSGEIKEFVLFDGKNELQGGATLKDLVEEWEDYEDQKKYWAIDGQGKVYELFEKFVNSKYRDEEKAIGNYFETKEEAEEAVEKLKAIKRLKDKGIKFKGWSTKHGNYEISFRFEGYYTKVDKQHSLEDDLDLLFGGEDEISK